MPRMAVASGVGSSRPSTTVFSSPSPEQDEATRLLERARAMRAEIATLEGRSVSEVEEEAQKNREKRQKVKLEQEQRVKERNSDQNLQDRQQRVNGSMLQVPETFEDQVVQAKAAVERAFRDGVNRQTVRFALIPEGQVLNEDRQWPGGAQQMYREAAGPLTRELVKMVKAPTKSNKEKDGEPVQSVDGFVKPPNVKSQDIWDFDGSALITAESTVGPSHDVQAMVLPNTDVKYIKDIATIDEAMGERLFLLVNPFWRDLSSWGINLLAPNAKKMAQQTIFDKGYEETYVLMKKSVRGEDCVCLKAYPYDWQLYAYADDEYWPNQSFLVRLGSTKEEPTAAEFGALLEQREEFKLSKNMRQMQRLMKDD